MVQQQQQPTETVTEQQPTLLPLELPVRAWRGDQELGTGQLSIGEDLVSWKPADGVSATEFSVTYPEIVLHAICRDLSKPEFQHECIYCLLDESAMPEPEEQGNVVNGTEGDENENDEEETVEVTNIPNKIRFVPIHPIVNGNCQLKAMYNSMAKGQELHPDDDDEEDDDYYGEQHMPSIMSIGDYNTENFFAPLPAENLYEPMDGNNLLTGFYTGEGEPPEFTEEGLANLARIQIVDSEEQMDQSNLNEEAVSMDALNGSDEQQFDDMSPEH